jgi:hypothetical protein
MIASVAMPVFAAVVRLTMLPNSPDVDDVLITDPSTGTRFRLVAVRGGEATGRNALHGRR